jgi:hypothetical protein
MFLVLFLFIARAILKLTEQFLALKPSPTISGFCLNDAFFCLNITPVSTVVVSFQKLSFVCLAIDNFSFLLFKSSEICGPLPFLYKKIHFWLLPDVARYSRAGSTNRFKSVKSRYGRLGGC